MIRTLRISNHHLEKVFFETIVKIKLQGAPEGVLDRCAFVRVGTNRVPLTGAIKAEIMKHVSAYGTGELK